MRGSFSLALIGIASLTSGCGSDTFGPTDLEVGTFAVAATGWIEKDHAPLDIDERVTGTACVAGSVLYFDDAAKQFRGVVTFPGEPVVGSYTLLDGGRGAPNGNVEWDKYPYGGSIIATSGVARVVKVTANAVQVEFDWEGSPSEVAERGVLAFDGHLNASRQTDCAPGA